MPHVWYSSAEESAETLIHYLNIVTTQLLGELMRYAPKRKDARNIDGTLILILRLDAWIESVARLLV